MIMTSLNRKLQEIMGGVAPFQAADFKSSEVDLAEMMLDVCVFTGVLKCIEMYNNSCY